MSRFLLKFALPLLEIQSVLLPNGTQTKLCSQSVRKLQLHIPAVVVGTPTTRAVITDVNMLYWGELKLPVSLMHQTIASGDLTELQKALNQLPPEHHNVIEAEYQPKCWPISPDVPRHCSQPHGCFCARHSSVVPY